MPWRDDGSALSEKEFFMEHFLSRLERATKSFWDKPVLNNFGGESFTFGQMATSIERFHIVFEKAGFKKGDKIAICARNSARWGIAFMAVSTYGTVIVPILADFLPEAVNNLVAHSESKALFTNADKWAKLDISKMPTVKVVVDVDNWSILYCADPVIAETYKNLGTIFAEKYPSGFGKDDVHFPIDNMDDLAAINYTSGSTGNPKGVMLTYRNFSANIEYASVTMPASEKDNILSMLPMAHMYGLAFEFIYPLCNGTAVYWLGKTPTPTMLLKAMAQVKPYLIITVPLVMEKIFRSKIKPIVDKPMMKVLTKIPGVNKLIFKKIKAGLVGAFGGKVQEFVMGGAALNPEVEKWFRLIGLPYTVGYGMTEACPLMAYAHTYDYVPGSCGKAITYCDIRIDSEDPHYIVGEIQAKGDNITIGYFNNPEASANAFTEDGYLHTGDLGVIDGEGNIFIRGRSKNMILGANGQNIYPEEVEAVVNNQDYVLESVVVDRCGKLVALVYLDEQAIAKNLLDNEAVSDIPENVKVCSNKLLPNYSQIAKVEVMTHPFEKTPKMSIKRFMYK